MAYRPQSSFSTGELTPELRERTDLEKYRSGLSIGRNALVGKMGSLISRSGTMFDWSPKFPNKPSIIYSPPYTQYVIELGVGYVRIYDTNDPTYQTFSDDPQPLQAADLPNVHFAVTSGLFVYIFCTGHVVQKMYLGALGPNPPTNVRFQTTANIFYYPPSPGPLGSYATTATGQPVDYAMSLIVNGQEGDYYEFLHAATGMNEPINNGEINTFGDIIFSSSVYGAVTGVNIYRRPSGLGGAYGYITTLAISSPSDTGFTFYDGSGVSVPDYTHSPPVLIPIQPIIFPHSLPIELVTSKTGAIYQQRLLITDDKNAESIYASRTGLQNDFFAETTLTPDSAIVFKSGSTGAANVIRVWDSQYGLLVFTTIGVYQNTGSLDYTNLSLEKVSSLVLQDNVPPLEVPGGLLVVDKSTNSVQSLIYSFVEQTFPPDEVSIFSYHLLANKQVTSWAFQDGEIPLVWIVLNDGSLLSLTYQREQQMRAWTHHDSSGALFESVTVLKNLQNQAVVYFQVNRNGTRSIESLSPRVLVDLKTFIAMDATTTFSNLLNAAAGGATFTITPQDITNWGGLLNLTSNLGAFANIVGQGKVGDIFRFFDSEGCVVDLQVVQFVSPTVLIVQPMFGLEFPSEQGTNVLLYSTFSTLTGLSYLNGQQVAITVDGFVEASPNNDIEKFNTYVVENGQITLQNGRLGAIINVGLPFTSDIETLELDTVEQKPTLLETKIVNKVWMKVLNSRGLYVSCDKLPENDSVLGMTDIETMQNKPIIGSTGNRAQLPITKRYQIISKNNYHSNGKVCVRQVDPLPFEILSIIPDLQVLI